MITATVALRLRLNAVEALGPSRGRSWPHQHSGERIRGVSASAPDLRRRALGNEISWPRAPRNKCRFHRADGVTDTAARVICPCDNWTRRESSPPIHLPRIEPSWSSTGFVGRSSQKSAKIFLGRGLHGWEFRKRRGESKGVAAISNASWLNRPLCEKPCDPRVYIRKKAPGMPNSTSRTRLFEPSPLAIIDEKAN